MKRRAQTGLLAFSLAEQSLAVLLAVAAFAIYALYSFFQWTHYVTPSWDLGIFTQLAQDYAHFQLPPIVQLKGANFDLWGDHFHPILLLLGPVYALFPSPVTLLYVQDALLAFSVYLLVRFAQRIVGLWQSLALGIAYGLSYGIQQAVSVQFHEVAFAPLFLMLSLGYLALSRLENTDQNLRRALLWSLPLVLVKEDLGITVLAIGAVVLWRSQWLSDAWDIVFPRPEQKSELSRWAQLKESLKINAPARLSLYTMLWGLIASLLAVMVILPLFNTAGVFDYANKVDFAAAIGDPLEAFGQLFYPWTKANSWGLLILLGAVAWVFSPIAIVVLPTLIWRFLSTQEGYWASTWHYSLVLMPMVFAALLDVLAKARLARAEKSADLEQVATSSEKNSLAKIPALRLLISPLLTWLLPTVALLVALVSIPAQPLKDLVINHAFATTELSATDQMKAAVVESIPENVSVATDLSVLTYLVPNREVYWIGNQGGAAPDYVVIDQAGTAWGGNPPKEPISYASELYKTPYKLSAQIGTIYVMKKGS